MKNDIWVDIQQIQKKRALQIHPVEHPRMFKLAPKHLGNYFPSNLAPLFLASHTINWQHSAIYISYQLSARMQKTLTQQPMQPLLQHLYMQKPMHLPEQNPDLQNQNPSCDEVFPNNLDAALVPVAINY